MDDYGGGASQIQRKNTNREVEEAIVYWHCHLLSTQTKKKKEGEEKKEEEEVMRESRKKNGR